MGIFSFFRTSPAKNDHGQPKNEAFRFQAVADRQIDELIGLIKGVLLDGHVSSLEAEGLLQWMDANRNAQSTWPASVLYPRLVRALQDGIVDEEEERDLLGLLVQTIGRNAPADGVASGATRLPLDDPQPVIVFQNRSFCFTGELYSGTREWCMEAVAAKGGVPVNTITKKLNYLVIGTTGSRDWAHSTHGRKIEKAVQYRDRGVPIAILGEEHWSRFLC